MNIWLKCETCNYNEHTVSNGSFSMKGCTKCGSSETRILMGGAKPEWYKPDSNDGIADQPTKPVSRPVGLLARIRAALEHKP